MKIFEKLVNSVKPIFVEGGKLEKFYPVYDGLLTFLFTPDHTTKRGAHVRDAIDLKRTMMTVIIALVPCLLFGMYNVGYQHFLAIGETGKTLMEMFLFGAFKVLPFVVVAYGVGLGVEFAFCIIKKHAIQEGFLVSGMLIPLIMPIETPLWMVAIATAFAVLIGKEVFGGTGMNIVNVALTARAFLFFAYPTKMSGNNVWVALDGEQAVDGFTGATALGDAYAGLMDKIPSVSEAFNGTILGSIGETSTIACLIGAFILLVTGIASWRIMFAGVLGATVMALLFNWAGANWFPDNAFLQLPFYHHMVLGGFAFGLVFMATDPVTAAQTNTGKWIYGFFIGLLAILIRTVNPAYPEGMMMAVLFMNIMAPLIDHYVIQGNVKSRLKRAVVANA